MITETEINLTIKNLKNLYSKEAELKEAIANQEALIKEYLKENNLHTITTESGSASWKEVFSKTLDMKAFRQAYEHLYQRFAIEKVSKRFKVAF